MPALERTDACAASEFLRRRGGEFDATSMRSLLGGATASLRLTNIECEPSTSKSVSIGATLCESTLAARGWCNSGDDEAACGISGARRNTGGAFDKSALGLTTGSRCNGGDAASEEGGANNAAARANKCSSRSHVRT